MNNTIIEFQLAAEVALAFAKEDSVLKNKMLDLLNSYIMELTIEDNFNEYNKEVSC